LEKAVAADGQRTEIIDVRSLSKNRASSKRWLLEVALFAVAVVVGWFVAWWLIG